MGALSVIDPGFLAVLAAGSALLWIASWSARHRRWQRALLAACAGLVTITFAADAVNAYFQYLPRVSDVLGQRDWPTVPQAALREIADVRATQPPAAGTSAPLPASARGTSASSAPRSTTPIAAPPLTTGPGGAASSSAVPWRRLVSGILAGRARGAVVTLTISDVGVGFDARRALVYLPPQYFSNPDERFPVVYLLHGSPGMPVDWLRAGGAATAGLAAARSGHPQILVMPHLSRNWLDDSECVDGAHMLVETYVVNDLVPAIDQQLRTMAEPAARAVAGMSAGGYCALNLGLRHRDLFGSIIDMSGFTHPTHSGGMRALFGPRSDLAAVVAANSPDMYAATLTPIPPTRIDMICGSSDHGALTQMQLMRDTLQRRGFPVTWSTHPGGHTYAVWRPGLAAALNWLTPPPQAPPQPSASP
jgi:enterochelin esterase-like enzyme